MNDSCKKYLCNKKVYSPGEWRKEMLRLRKEHAPHFEKHPDYIKTAQCKDDISDEQLCKLYGFYGKASNARNSPNEKPNPKTQHYNKNESYENQYEEYLRRMKEYEMDMDALRSEKRTFDLLGSKIQETNGKYNIITQDLAFLERDKKELTEKLKELRPQFKEVEYNIKILEKKNKYKPVPPNKPSPSSSNNKTKKEKSSKKKETEKSPSSIEHDETKRCPKGYTRNKTTKRCQKTSKK